MALLNIACALPRDPRSVGECSFGGCFVAIFVVYVPEVDEQRLIWLLVLTAVRDRQYTVGSVNIMVDIIQAVLEAMCLLSCFRTSMELDAGLAPDITPLDVPNSAYSQCNVFICCSHSSGYRPHRSRLF